MPKANKFWLVLVFILGSLAYVTVAIGGWKHPDELNIAQYGVWGLLSAMIGYSSYKQKFPMFYMTISWVVGNIFLVLFGLCHGGYTFNMGPVEATCFFGIVVTLAVWTTAAAFTRRSNPHILLLGGICADVASFYPLLKQYLLPHDQPTLWMVAGWVLWFIASSIQIVFVDRFFSRLQGKNENRLAILEASAIPIENCILLFVTICVMMR